MKSPIILCVLATLTAISFAQLNTTETDFNSTAPLNSTTPLDETPVNFTASDNDSEIETENFPINNTNAVSNITEPVPTNTSTAQPLNTTIVNENDTQTTPQTTPTEPLKQTTVSSDSDDDAGFRLIIIILLSLLLVICLVPWVVLLIIHFRKRGQVSKISMAREEKN